MERTGEEASVVVALQNAASVASLILTTEAILAEIPEDKPAPAGVPGGAGGFGGGEF
ncbi:MAG TPA: hypothetical protein PKA20_00650 [Burkholderiaceae bacterium]|nr:hypothetical protein [Burkholderiaceae bacterium]